VKMNAMNICLFALVVFCLVLLHPNFAKLAEVKKSSECSIV